MQTNPLPNSPSISQLKLQAKALWEEHQSGDQEACMLIREYHPRYSDLPAYNIVSEKLSHADCLLVMARKHGFSTWPKLKRHIEEFEDVEKDVQTLISDFAEGSLESRKLLIAGYHDMNRFESPDPNADAISDHDARVLLANKRGYAHWVKYYDYQNLDPGVRDVILAIQANDLAGLKRALSLDAQAANPTYRVGYEPLDPTFSNFSNDSIPLFEVSESVFNGMIPVDTSEYEMTETLIDSGADHGHPLTAAVSFNAINVVQALLDEGASVDGPYGHGCPMAFSMHFGFDRIADLLVDRGAKLDLRFASGIGDLDMVKSFFTPDGSLVEGAGILADPYTRSESADDKSRYKMERSDRNVLQQAFYFACRAAKFETAEFLLGQEMNGINAIVPGLDVDTTTLHWCCWWGSSSGQTLDREKKEKRALDTTQFLLDRGADPNSTQAPRKATPLKWAASERIANLIRKFVVDK